MSYDDAYKKIPDYFGAEPSPLLKKHCRLLDKTKPVLDIGAGQGRNSFFLARQGYAVEALEPAQAGIEIITDITNRENLPINPYCIAFENFIPGHSLYGAILVLGIIQVLTWDSIRTLIHKIRTWIDPEGYIFISAFSTDDPGLPNIIASSEKIGHNSYLIGDKTYRTFLEPGQIMELFKGYQAIHYWEGPGPVHTHGGKNPHRHAVIHAVLKR